MEKNISRSEELKNKKEIFAQETFCRIFHDTAMCYPEKTAVVDEYRFWTYQELDEYSNYVARVLKDRGLKREEIVSIRTGRSSYAILAMLSVWKAGAACYYTGTCYPKSEIMNIQNRCRCRFVITEQFFTDMDMERDPDYFDESTGNGLSLIIFTSGTTKNPKGVLIEDRNLTAAASNFDRLGMETDDRVCVFASFSFIASMYDIVSAMSVGATLYIIPEQFRKKIACIVDYWKKNKITQSFLPPHMAVKLMSIDEKEITLRRLLVGSEPVRNLEKRKFRIINVYACSELCALISIYDIHEKAQEYPIGTVNPTIHWYIVDEEGKPVKDGETGELWLSGPQVARGYFQQEQLTGERFAANPFEKEKPFDRLFKSGDMVCLDDKGQLWYKGRKDTMFKIRGFRVEASAVEGAIEEYPGVEETVVKAFADKGGTNILCAYFTASRNIDVKKMKRDLRNTLPYYMIPTCMIQVDDFTRTRTGKICIGDIKPPPELDDHKLLERLY